jgi:hypothetical protein
VFLRAVDVVLTVVGYALTFFLGFIVVGIFVLVFFEAAWTALFAGVGGGFVAVWFMRGLMRDVDKVLDPLFDRIFGVSPRDADPSPNADPHDRLRRLSELREEGHLSAEEYEAKRRVILREL